MQPKVTVYITTFNYGQYLTSAIESVLSQNMKEWELIIIDDESKDNTSHILKRYDKYSKIRIVRQQNKGLLVSCNIALRLSRGKYIIRLDGDDFLDENALLVMSRVLDSKKDVGFVYPDYYTINKEGELIDIVRQRKIGREMQLLDIAAHGACAMIRKSCLVKIGGYDESFYCQDGYYLWLKFLGKYKPYNVNIPLFYYRQHRVSLSRDKRKILRTRRSIKEKILTEARRGKRPRVLAIIPTRASSDSAFSMKKITHRPLLYYTIREALKTPLLDKIVVASDENAVLNYAKKFKKIKTLRRPNEVSGLNENIGVLVEYVLQILRKSESYVPDCVVLLFVRNPLKKSCHIEEAINTLLIFNVDSVIAVCNDSNTYYVHRQWGLEPVVRKKKLRLERDTLYKDTYSICVSNVKVITKNAFLGRTIGHIIMLPEESVNVMDDFGFWIVKKIMEEYGK